MNYLEKLAPVAMRFDEVQQKLSDPNITSNVDEYTRLSKEYKELEKVYHVYKQYKDTISNIEANKKIIQEESDPEFKEMAKQELETLQSQQTQLENDIKIILIPKDPEDEKNVMLEIRAGTGGDEASIFSGDLLRMYINFADSKGWPTELISSNEGSSGGYKEVVVRVTGENVYGILKYESGVHRVQRVPKTESQGRVHTSAASVAVLPEVDDVAVDINPADLRIDTYRSSGAGGQHVNKTESAVRITHNPTGIVVECQEGRSQLRNREIAMQWLRAKLYEQAVAKQHAEIASQRKSQVSTGDRSAKIRTYNFPQGRVTDHRIGLTLYTLDDVINGNLDELISKLQMAEQAEKLSAMESH